MSTRKPYRHPKKGTGRHVQLPEWLQASEAWRTMKPGPRALYIELKRRYNGRNNGNIILSHRQAAEALAVHRNTVGAWFEELEARGFIWMAQGPYLGPSGIGQASVWGLTEEMTQDMKPARKTFMAWRENQEPRTKSVPPRHKKQDAKGEVSPVKASPVLKIVT
jgi:DNA-binding transcriptional MocR family regulator